MRYRPTYRERHTLVRYIGQLHLGGDDFATRDAFSSFCEAGFEANREKWEKILDVEYKILSVLDSKASSLLRVNGIFTAACAFLIGVGIDTSDPQEVILVFSIAIFFLSSVLAFLVVAVAWPFLAKPGDDWITETLELEEAVEARTRNYQLAWLLTALGGFVFSVAAVGVPAYKWIIC